MEIKIMTKEYFKIDEGTIGYKETITTKIHLCDIEQRIRYLENAIETYHTVEIVSTITRLDYWGESRLEMKSDLFVNKELLKKFKVITEG